MRGMCTEVPPQPRIVWTHAPATTVNIAVYCTTLLYLDLIFLHWYDYLDAGGAAAGEGAGGRDADNVQRMFRRGARRDWGGTVVR